MKKGLLLSEDGRRPRFGVETPLSGRSRPSGSEDPGARRPILLVLLTGLEGLAEDFAERRARVGRTVLRDSLLLFGELQRLDREGRLLGAVETGHHRVELLADLETLGALLVAIAAKV